MALYVKYQESKSVPEGIYSARVDGLESINHAEYGEGIKWSFTIQDPNNSAVHGAIVTTISSTKVSPKSKLYSWLQAFGILLDVDQQFDIESLLGQMCRIKVANKIQKKVVGGVERTLTFSNVIGVGPYRAQATTTPAAQAAIPTQAPTQTAAYRPQTQTPPPQASVVPQDQLDVDEEFDF